MNFYNYAKVVIFIYICGMLLFPNAKINVGLDVLRRREDGFHELATVMVPVARLRDVVEITRAPQTEFVETGMATGCPAEENLCMRAYRLMQKEHGIGEARIHLHKIIPSGAGLGGGSADAAFVLKGLNEVFEAGLSVARLEELAARLGSDTAFFIQNRTQLATGRGEILTPIDLDLSGKYLILVLPPIHVSTKEAYGSITPHEPDTTLLQRLWSATNAFEPSIFEKHPILKRIKSALKEHGATYASMSGSGSAMFGLFDTKPAPFCFYEKKCVTLQFEL